MEVANTGENSMKVDGTEALCREWGKREVGGWKSEVGWENEPPKRDSPVEIQSLGPPPSESQADGPREEGKR